MPTRAFLLHQNTSARGPHRSGTSCSHPIPSSKPTNYNQLIYIDRLIQRNNFILSGLNVHRVVITSVMLAAKFFDDQVTNAKGGPLTRHALE